MKRIETESQVQNSRRYAYTKVCDARKHPVRGLWKRNGGYVARVTVEETTGAKVLKWIPLKATCPASAIAEMKTLHVERDENRLRHVGMTPKLADFIGTYLESLAASGKRKATIVKERGCLARWAERLGKLRLDKLRPHHLTGHLDELKKQGLSGRTVNLHLVALRHLMRKAKRDGFLKVLPTADLEWQKFDTKKRKLFSPAEFEMVCATALTASKNGEQLADYLRLLAYSGARRNEGLALKWTEVDFDRKQITIGADGFAKSRKPRTVDMTPALEAHLRDMFSRRAPDSHWIFPSPQRGDKDLCSHGFVESLKLARALLPPSLRWFSFHDARHYFISYAVMSGVPIMTIASWVGHADGGLLIGKVYGHLCDEHKKAQAARVNFGPTIVEMPQAATA